jgi:hypothetical protein
VGVPRRDCGGEGRCGVDLGLIGRRRGWGDPIGRRGEEQGLYFLLLHVAVKIYAEHMLNISLLVRFRDLKMRFNWKHIQLWKYSY